MNKTKQDKGISLVSLAVAIGVILIITGTILYQTTNGNKIAKLNQLNNDIVNLRDKVSLYYLKHRALPVLRDYTITDNINVIPQAQREHEEEGYSVIDLELLENLQLNYGSDYEQVKDLTIPIDRNKTDLYVINNKTHVIYYIKGIELESTYYYRSTEE